MVAGEDLYRYDGQVFPARRDTGPAPECRLEVSPTQPSATDLFLHVLTATDASVESVPPGAVERAAGQVEVSVGEPRLALRQQTWGGDITWRGETARLGD